MEETSALQLEQQNATISRVDNLSIMRMENLEKANEVEVEVEEASSKEPKAKAYPTYVEKQIPDTEKHITGSSKEAMVTGSVIKQAKASGFCKANIDLTSQKRSDLISPEHLALVPPHTRKVKAEPRFILNHFTRTFSINFQRIANYLNQTPYEPNTNSNEPKGWKTSPMEKINRLIALPGTAADLIRDAYNYGLLHSVYTSTREEIESLPTAIFNAMKSFMAITKAGMVFVRFYQTVSELGCHTVYPSINVVKIGIAREFQYPEPIKQDVLSLEDIPELLQEKRAMGIAIAVQDLRKTLTDQNKNDTYNKIWIYANSNNMLVYCKGKSASANSMDTIEKWIVALSRPEEDTGHKSIKRNYCGEEVKKRLCKWLQHIELHQCNYCKVTQNVIPELSNHYGSEVGPSETMGKEEKEEVDKEDKEDKCDLIL